MTCKVVMFLTDGGVGWSEVYYGTDIDPFVGLSVLRTNGPAGDPLYDLVQARRGLLSAVCNIIRVRMSIEGNPRDADAATINDVNGIGLYEPSPQQEDWTTLLIRQTAQTLLGVTFHKNLFLSGIPRDQESPAETYNPSADWKKRIGALRTELLRPHWLLKSRPSAVLSPPLNITAFQTGTNGLFAAIQPDLAIPAGTFGACILRGLKAPRGWNGYHRCFSAAAVAPLVGTATYIGPVRRPGVTVPPFGSLPGGTIQPAGVYQYNQIKAVEDVRIVEHKRGRPFGALRGRRSPA